MTGCAGYRSLAVALVAWTACGWGPGSLVALAAAPAQASPQNAASRGNRGSTPLPRASDGRQAAPGGIPLPVLTACTPTTNVASDSIVVPGLAIPDDGATLSRQLFVAGAGPYLADVGLTTAIRHTFSGDLDITLTSPAGTVVTVTTDNGGSFDDVFAATQWDDDAGTNGVNLPVTDAVFANGVVETPLVPEEAFGAFIGENPNGTWTLDIFDDTSPDTGTLDAWSLQLSTLPGAPVTTTTAFSDPANVPIPDWPSSPLTDLARVLDVAGAGTPLIDLNLTTAITHPSSDDLILRPISPSGTIVMITSGSGGNTTDVFNGTRWDDSAGATNPPGPVTDNVFGSSSVETPLVPEGALAAFIGEDPNGQWILPVSDITTGDTGVLHSWSLDIMTGACQADFTLTKLAAPDPVSAGAPLAYTLGFGNTGFSAGDAAVTDPLPADTTFQSLTPPAGWACTTPAVGATGTVSCTKPSVAVGETGTFVIGVGVSPAPTGTLIGNTASVAPLDATPANNSATFVSTVSPADFSLTKLGAPEPVSAGGSLTYTLTVLNNGPSPGGATVTDPLPAGTTFQSVTPPAGWACTTPAVGATGTVSCTNPAVPAGETGTFTIQVAVSPAADGTTLTNTASVAAALDSAPANNSATFVSTVQTPPTVTINTPAGPTTTSTSAFVDLGGTVTDESALASVTWTNNKGGSGTATLTRPGDGAAASLAPVGKAPRLARASSGPASDDPAAVSTTWGIADVPLQPGANVVTVTATDTSGNKATDQLTVTVSTLLYSLAEGATGPFFDLDVALGNPHAVPAPITVTYLLEDGSTVVQSDTLAALSRKTIRVNDVAGLATSAVSTVVSSDTALALPVARTMFWDAGAPARPGTAGAAEAHGADDAALTPGAFYYGGHTAGAVQNPQLQWLFAEGQQGFFDTYLLLASTNPTPATVTVTYLVEGGAPVVQLVTVAPTSRLTLFAGALPDLVGKSFGIRVVSDLPIFAERAMYFPRPGAGGLPGARMFEGGHESAGVPAAATSWFLAEGATGAFFDTFVLASNPSTTNPATATVTYLPTTGVPVVKVHTVPANGRITINVETEDPTLAVAEVSTAVTSDISIVVERAMYWNGGVTGWHAAHNAFGVTATALKRGIAEGRVGQSQGFLSFILLANPAPAPATVQITYLRTAGAPVVKTYTVNPTSRLNVAVNSEVPELVNEDFAAVVAVTNGIPIAVESALYWTAPAPELFFTGGTNATAVPLP